MQVLAMLASANLYNLSDADHADLSASRNGYVVIF